MKKIKALLVYVAAISSIGAFGYWLGSSRMAAAPQQVLQKTERKILYYRNPMGLADKSPVPRKDAMGMDYVPVYEGEAETNAVEIGSERVQKLGVTSEAAAMRVLQRSLKAAARIEVDERHLYSISPKFEGWVDRLYVNSTGQQVAKGEPLFDVYSPELVSLQREYALARQGAADIEDSDARAGMERLADATLLRMKNWDMGEIKKSDAVRRNLTYVSPVAGIVLEKKALQGMRFMPGEVLYQIADLSSVWVVADLPEQDVARVAVGNVAQIALTAYPGQVFTGKIAFIYPVLNAATRTAQVRVTLANPHGQFKPGMFASLSFASDSTERVLTIPASAVIDSGTRKVALVRLGVGRFEPREIRTGARGDDYVEVLEGIFEGEQVVTSANFLIDAESNLKAALGGLGSPQHEGH